MLARTPMLGAMRARLVLELARRVHSGEFSERSLARRLNVSQPHIHNILKGVRVMSVEFADHVIAELEIPLERLLTPEHLQQIRKD